MLPLSEQRWDGRRVLHARKSVYRISQPVDAYLYVALKRANTSFKLAEELRTRSPQERAVLEHNKMFLCTPRFWGFIWTRELAPFKLLFAPTVESCSLLLKNEGKGGCNEVVCASQTPNFVLYAETNILEKKQFFCSCCHKINFIEWCNEQKCKRS